MSYFAKKQDNGFLVTSTLSRLICLLSILQVSLGIRLTALAKQIVLYSFRPEMYCLR